MLTPGIQPSARACVTFIMRAPSAHVIPGAIASQ